MVRHDWRHYFVVGIAYLMVPFAGWIGVERVHDWLRRLAIRVYGKDAIQ